jgi:hypothetical protein
MDKNSLKKIFPQEEENKEEKTIIPYDKFFF